MNHPLGEVPRPSPDPERYSELVQVLWRLELALERLVFRLTVQHWVLERLDARHAEPVSRVPSPDGTLVVACADVKSALDALQRRDLIRAAVLSRLGNELGLGPEPVLGDLRGHDLRGHDLSPWAAVADDHRQRMGDLSAEMVRAVGANAELVRSETEQAASQLSSGADALAAEVQLTLLGRLAVLREAGAVLTRASRCSVVSFVGAGS